MSIGKRIQDKLIQLYNTFKKELSTISFKDKADLYKKNKSILYLDTISAYCLIGILIYGFIVGPSLDLQSLKYYGVIFITVSVSLAFVYDYVFKYILNQVNRKNWISG